MQKVEFGHVVVLCELDAKTVLRLHVVRPHRLQHIIAAIVTSRERVTHRHALSV